MDSEPERKQELPSPKDTLYFDGKRNLMLGKPAAYTIQAGIAGIVLVVSSDKLHLPSLPAPDWHLAKGVLELVIGVIYLAAVILKFTSANGYSDSLGATTT
jgi:hypothetical protein